MNSDFLSRFEVARSILNALAYSGSCIANKCHINKINNRSLFFGFEDGLKSYLETLQELGEAYHLGSGYWTTTPTRNIQLDGFWLILSSLPKVHFPESIKCIDSFGLGRVSETPFPNVVSQDLHDWMRVPGEINSWIMSILDNARISLTPSSLRPEDHEFFVPSSVSNSSSPKFWLPANKVINSYNGVVLIRTLTRTPRYYFWGRIEGDMLLESNCSIHKDDIPRLRIAIELLQGYKRTAIVTSDSKKITLKVNFQLPTQEARLLLAIGSESQEGYTKQYTCPVHFENLLEFELSKIGIIFRRK